MKKKSLDIILIAAIVCIINSVVFFVMSDYVSTHQDFISVFMYYLTIVLIVISGFIAYAGYRDLSFLTLNKKILAHSIFYAHMLWIAIFLGSLWFSLN